MNKIEQNQINTLECKNIERTNIQWKTDLSDVEVTLQVTGSQNIIQSFQSHLFLLVFRKEILPFHVLQTEKKESR